MPDRIVGKISHNPYWQKLSRIFSTRKQVGAVQNAKGNTLSTSITLFVPRPTDVRHLPGIFLTLSNGSGAAFTRLTIEDFQSIIEWMQLCTVPLLRSYEEAVRIRAKFIALDRELQSITMAQEINIEEKYELELKGLTSLMEDPPS